MFRPIASQVNFPKLEEEVLRFWKEHRIFERSVEERQKAEAPLFVLYEGPPTANGSPGIHHVLARVFKDIIPRYKTMKGYCVPRKGGWDTHGLPVELEVERELGLSAKREIEDYGIAAFNARCRDSVFRYVREWEEMTDRIGFWIDMKDAYVTLDNGYIESCWWIIKQLWDKGLIYQGHKVTPHCPRCETSLSSHEVSLGYRDDAEDPSILVRFRLRTGVQQIGWQRGSLEKLGWDFQNNRWTEGRPSLLVWTTTPWTLTANVAAAVAPDDTYALVETQGPEGVVERLIIAKARLEATLAPASWKILAELQGSELSGLYYEPVYHFNSPSQYFHRVVPADFVSMAEGTGIVHIAPAFGEDDLELSRSEGLPLIHTVDLNGLLSAEVAPWAGRFVKDADPLIIAELQSRGLILRSERIVHTYPFCWRCDSPLLYYAKTSWYIRTTARTERLLSGNDEINWYPSHIKDGRFGDWLRNNVDWALSRERYWGTPLPIWRCDGCGGFECVGGLEELRAKDSVQWPQGALDLHRPFVDHITFRCSHCQGTMRRVSEVADCWFDSGAMPVAQWHYPFENRERFAERFPADYICEALDQTRGWFYTLHALSILLFDEPCYRNVICLGLILDSQGEKMSKSRGNVVDPWDVLNSHGADALRWYLYTASPPGNPRRFSVDLVGESLRRFLLTLWNTYSFFVTYANIDGFDPTKVAERPLPSDLDRWILSCLHRLTADVDHALAHYDPTGGGRRIAQFVDLLSNWYVRRSRRRFWKSESDADKLSAYLTLYECLVALAKLLAPFTPFLAEELYQNLVRSMDGRAQDSVHLAQFPEPDLSLIDEQLMADTELVMRIASLGRAARSKAGIKVRQPLTQALVRVRNEQEGAALERLESQLTEEINVKGLVVYCGEAGERDLWDWRVRPNMAKLGPKYGRRAREIADALAKENPSLVAANIVAGNGYWLRDIDVALEPDEVLCERVERPGYAIAEEGGHAVAVDTEVTPELRAEGLARELVRRLQEMRRTAGFDIADRIVTHYQGPAALREVMDSFGDYIRRETLSLQLVEGPPPSGAYEEAQRVEGLEVLLAVKRG